MLIIPAIDIMDGKCVRLTKGKFSSKKIYSDDPVSVAKKFERDGAQMIHVIDLDGAKMGEPKNISTIKKIAAAVKIPIEVGGGIRSIKSAETYLNGGISRIILGTKAAESGDFIKKLIKKYGNERIVISIDVRDGKVSTNGWQTDGERDALSFARTIKSLGVTKIIVTDIMRDGTLTTPNFEMTRQIKEIGFNVIAAGGVSDAESIKQLKSIKIDGAILGKALYENKINLKAAILAARPLSGLAKRIIPCLDVKNGRTVKGVNFVNLRDAGDAIELGAKYSDEGADELVFLDITASAENRETTIGMVRRIAERISIPFTVGGGIKTIDDIRALLRAGADKVTLNTAAVYNPELISRAAELFGSQCIVVSIDIKKVVDTYKVFIKGGREETALEAVSWAREVARLGAGEIMLTSMDRDGTRSGFDTEILREISSAVNIPVIASGGAGSLKDLKEAFTIGCADAALAASIFHYNKISIKDAKEYLCSCNIPIRL